MPYRLKNKAMLFALYWGQLVAKHVDYDTSVPKTIVDGSIMSSGWYLELQPLSQISDEDAEYCIGEAKCRMWKNDPKHDDYGMSPSAMFINSIKDDDSYHIARREADYLRSKGYALKYMNKSVKEQVSDGWIKLKKD